MAQRVIGYKDVLAWLKEGKEVHYMGGITPSAFIHSEHETITVRIDTLYKLWEQGIITDFGYPALHSTVRLKEASNE